MKIEKVTEKSVKYDPLDDNSLFIGDDECVFCITVDTGYNFIVLVFEARGIKLLEVGDSSVWFEFEDVERDLLKHFNTIKRFDGEIKLSN